MKKIISLLTSFLILFSLALPAFAAEAAEEADEPQEIWTVEDLKDMGPEGDYILMADLDMTGIAWKPMLFFGTLDGNGHGILNLELTQFSNFKTTTLDGNQKKYETRMAGLFASLENATVKNLKLLGVTAVLESEEPSYIGALAGTAFDAVIENCEIQASLELRAHEGVFGVGGVIGYGSGRVENTNVDVTLITVDTDAATRDEQFLGGILAMGFADMVSCDVKIDAYISEHGYVHSGGLCGLYMQSPLGFNRAGSTINNTISGQITFFEDNTDRRAYCNPLCGERLAWNYKSLGNISQFRGVEVRDYTTELRPEKCAVPNYKVTEVPADCDGFGYTESVCTECGMTIRNDYTPRLHKVTQWEVLEPATVKASGISEGRCDLCEETIHRVDDPLPEPTTVPTEPATEAEPTEETPAQTKPEKGKTDVGAIIARLVVLLCVGTAGFLLVFLKHFVKPTKG